MTDEPTTQQALDAVRTLIRYIGDDPRREGLVETPERVLRAWTGDWGKGYMPLSSPLVKLFSTEVSALADPVMVIVRDIRFFSTCEHHMAPFFGRATIGYIPRRDRRLGLSKFARIVDHFASRLQVQERLTDEIADYITEEVSRDVAVVMQATHMCMASRGVKQPDAQTVTSALRGDFLDAPETRAEFYAAARAQGFGV